MVQQPRKSLILAKVETTYGSDPTPTTASNAILAQDVEIKPIKAPIERPIQLATLMRKPSLAGEEYVEITFKAEITGSGSAGTAPRVGALLKGCGMSETVITGGSPYVAYRDASSSLDSVAFYIYKGGRLFKAFGAVGNVKGVFEAGQIGMLEFTFMGKKGAAPAITSIPTDAVYDDASGSVLICKNGTFSYNSKTTLITPMLDFDLQNVLTKRPNLAATEAVEGFFVGDRNIKMSINPETQVETSYDFYGDSLTNVRELSYTAGSLFTITATKFNPYQPDFEDIESVLHDKIEGEASQDTSNNYALELKWEG